MMTMIPRMLPHALCLLVIAGSVSSMNAADSAATMPEPATAPKLLPQSPIDASVWTPAEATRWRQRFTALGAVELPAPRLITNERQRISAKKPEAWAAATRLRGLQHLSPGALDADSLEIRWGDRQLTLARLGSPAAATADVLFDAAWGGLGLGPSGTLTTNDEVTIAYKISMRRIDGLIRQADGHEVVRLGVPAQITPAMPVVQPGETLLATMFFDYRQNAQTAEVLPVLMAPGSPAPATTGPEALPAIVAKLRAGGTARIICWGDSVTAGGDLEPGQAFGDLLKARLKKDYPQALEWTIAVGGTNSRQWLRSAYPAVGAPGAWAEQCDFARIVDAKPDLVIIEFVNDQWCTTSEGIALYRQWIARIKALGSEVLLLTPQHNWEHGNLRDPDTRGLVGAYRVLGHEGPGVGVADMAGRWERLWREGIPYPALLANGFNHPDARGHQLFYEEICHALAITP